MLYRCYRVGQWLALTLPLAVSYWCAARLADLQSLVAAADRHAVQRNVAAILGAGHPGLPRVAREVFRNFARYLVDFFRFQRVDEDFCRRRVTVVGRDHVDQALTQGRGAILLSAHLGNYELGAVVASVLGYPVTVIALNHRDPQIDAFFQRQRAVRGVRSIPVGMALRQGFLALRRNELLAILGDRDFFDHGITVEFLGRRMKVPQGPALFSIRTGASIIPAFLLREPDGVRFRFVFERPLTPSPASPPEAASVGRPLGPKVGDGVTLQRTADEAREVARLTQAGLAVIEQYVRRYPTQWYLFRDFDRPGPWVIL